MKVRNRSCSISKSPSVLFHDEWGTRNQQSAKTATAKTHVTAPKSQSETVEHLVESQIPQATVIGSR